MKLIISSVFLVLTLSLFSQTEYEKEIRSFQDELNNQYADTIESPMLREDIKDFKGLDFFPINENYLVNAVFIKKFNPVVVTLKTTTDRAPKYNIYAEVHFKLDNQDFKLNVYQNVKIDEDDEYKEHLFLPFTDLTNSVSSYGGGRYVDLKIPDGDTIVIDFNRAYNPYCAYNHKYSCVVPPAENFMNTRIEAGVKKFNKNH